jgi:hypothetical protein
MGLLRRECDLNVFLRCIVSILHFGILRALAFLVLFSTNYLLSSHGNFVSLSSNTLSIRDSSYLSKSLLQIRYLPPFCSDPTRLYLNMYNGHHIRRMYLSLVAELGHLLGLVRQLCGLQWYGMRRKVRRL